MTPPLLTKWPNPLNLTSTFSIQIMITVFSIISLGFFLDVLGETVQFQQNPAAPAFGLGYFDVIIEGLIF